MTLPATANTLSLTVPAGYSTRPAAPADLTAVVAMLNRCSRALVGVDQHSLVNWTSAWSSPGFQLERDSQVVLAPDGELAGYVNLWDNAPHVQFELFGQVSPNHTGQGLGSYLLAWAETCARAQLHLAPPAARVTLITDSVNSLDTAAHSLLRDHGYQHIRSAWRMVIDLDPATPPATPVWPAGVSVRRFVPGSDDHTAVEVVREAFRDHWGHIEQPFEEDFEEWTHYWNSNPTFDPSLWFLAVAGDEVIGTAFCRPEVPDDPHMGWVFSLGVLRPWRRRGVAGALLRHCFAQLWQRGRRRVGLGVDAGSLTNAVHLYEAAGMRSDPTQTYQVWEKELRPGDAP